jgi:hypothetical protein
MIEQKIIEAQCCAWCGDFDHSKTCQYRVVGKQCDGVKESTPAILALIKEEYGEPLDKGRRVMNKPIRESSAFNNKLAAILDAHDISWDDTDEIIADISDLVFEEQKDREGELTVAYMMGADDMKAKNRLLVEALEYTKTNLKMNGIELPQLMKLIDTALKGVR